MERTFYLDLAAANARMPIGTHLVLHEQPNPEGVLLDGALLADVVRRAAARFRTPLAVPLMDLTLEKAALLQACGLGSSADEFHFTEPPPAEYAFQLTPRMSATCDAIRCIAADSPELVPVGMAIGPFSLTTKLLSDPIAPVYLASQSGCEQDEPEVQVLRASLKLATQLVQDYVEAQIAAGAKAIIICEPAANQVYFSPRQLSKSFRVFDECVMEPNTRLRNLMRDAGVDLIFHDCGELTGEMLQRFTQLDPAILSLGSSRKLWEDAASVPKSTVLYGNLPSKRFYSDSLISIDEVRRMSGELRTRMQSVGHPFILGSECDVLSVPGSEATIAAKVNAMMDA